MPRPTDTARRLGWFSLGLGALEVAAPRALARVLGTRPNPALTRTAYGLRELGVGAGLVTAPSAGWVWARVAGDVLDLATLGAALRGPRARPVPIALAAVGVAAVTALDVKTALALRRTLDDGASSWKGATAPSVPPDAQRITASVRVGRPPDHVYRAWRDPLTVARMVEPYLEVDAQSPDLARLRVRGPAGAVARWSWDVPEERAPTTASSGFMRFRTLEGATVRSDGTARLRPAEGGRSTDLEVEARFQTPLGHTADAVWTVGGLVPTAALEDVLGRFKRLVEDGDAPTSSEAVRESDGPEPVPPVDAPSGPAGPPPAERR